MVHKPHQSVLDVIKVFQTPNSDFVCSKIPLVENTNTTFPSRQRGPRRYQILTDYLTLSVFVLQSFTTGGLKKMSFTIFSAEFIDPVDLKWCPSAQIVTVSQTIVNCKSRGFIFHHLRDLILGLFPRMRWRSFAVRCWRCATCSRRRRCSSCRSCGCSWNRPTKPVASCSTASVRPSAAASGWLRRGRWTGSWSEAWSTISRSEMFPLPRCWVVTVKPTHPQ